MFTLVASDPDCVECPGGHPSNFWRPASLGVAMPSPPPIRYAQVDGLNLAYQVVGDGPLDLILIDEWATPLEARRDVPPSRGVSTDSHRSPG